VPKNRPDLPVDRRVRAEPSSRSVHRAKEALDLFRGLVGVPDEGMIDLASSELA